MRVSRRGGYGTTPTGCRCDARGARRRDATAPPAPLGRRRKALAAEHCGEARPGEAEVVVEHVIQRLPGDGLDVTACPVSGSLRAARNRPPGHARISETCQDQRARIAR